MEVSECLLEPFDKKSPTKSVAVIPNVHLVGSLSQVEDNIRASLSFGFIHNIPASNALKVRVASIVHHILDNIELIFSSRDVQGAPTVLILDVWPQKSMIFKKLQRYNVSVSRSVILPIIVLLQIWHSPIGICEFLDNRKFSSEVATCFTK